MTQPANDQFTLLYEDGNTKVLHTFKGVFADDVVQHMIDFLKGCGYMEDTVFEAMNGLAVSYFNSLKTKECLMKWDKPESE